MSGSQAHTHKLLINLFNLCQPINHYYLTNLLKPKITLTSRTVNTKTYQENVCDRGVDLSVWRFKTYSSAFISTLCLFSRCPDLGATFSVCVCVHVRASSVLISLLFTSSHIGWGHWRPSILSRSGDLWTRDLIGWTRSVRKRRRRTQTHVYGKKSPRKIFWNQI